MRRLVRLYPRAWRDRYGPELETLLTETPTSLRDVADLVVAAGRAHGRVMQEWLRAPRQRRAGAWAGLVGGGLWATTFLVGWMVEWGRYGRDLGSLLLAGAAGLLVVAQLLMAGQTVGPSRAMTWAGTLAALGGGLTLVFAVLAAIVLEPPLVIRLPVLPSTLWDQGMLLVMVGLAVSSAARWASSPGRGGSLRDAVAGLAAIVLAVALFVPFEADVIIPMVSESGGSGGGFLQLLAPVGWFVTNPLVVAAGVVFGAGWAFVGWARLFSPEPSAVDSAVERAW